MIPRASHPESWSEIALGEINQYRSKNVQPKDSPDEPFELWSVPIFPTGKPEVLLGSEIGSSKQAVEPRDVLICKINPRINRVWEVGQKASYRQVASSEWIVVRQPLMEPRYLLRFFQSDQFRTRLCADVTGVGGSLTRAQPKKVATFPIVVPPLAEQKVIADKLDTLLAQVGNTKARLEHIPKILKRFRQSVLAAAVSGRLTEEWRSNSESYVHENAEDWKWAPVPTTWVVRFYPELVESRLGKMLDKAKNSGLPTKYLGNINVRWFDFNLSEVQEILVSESERKELSIRPGDVLICEGGEPGRCAIWDGRVEEQIVFQKALHRARVSEALLPEWLTLNLKHDADSLTLEQLFTGTTIKHLTGKALKKYPLRVPPIEEQTEIVGRVDQLFAHADRVEQHANRALARVHNLTQSILAKAFRGELTDQWRSENPELISGEESADSLLRRIKAERDQQNKQPRKRRAGKEEKVVKKMDKKIGVVEALKRMGEPLSGQQLLAAAGYAADSSTEDLELFFLDLRDALTVEQKVVKLYRDRDGQDWFALPEMANKCHGKTNESR